MRQVAERAKALLEPLTRRFWAKVDKRGPDECWEWTARRSAFGYGRVSAAFGKLETHRLAFFLTHGRWPKPCCCHRCDNPPCCNPAHLFEGTHADNTRDMIAKGRGFIPKRERTRPPRGAPRPRRSGAKLNEQQVRDVRANHALCRVSLAELGRRFGVSPGAISFIVKGISWRDLLP